MSIRLASANAYDNALDQLNARQNKLSKLQEQMTAGKKVLRPSDDPTAAAQAERASTRIARVTSDQRALEVQRNAIATAESTLGDAVGALQSFRTLVVQAGSGSVSVADRATIAQQLGTLRDQILGYANTRDSNGQPLFGGLGSTGSPFVDLGTGVVFDGIGGQQSAGEVSIPTALDGKSTFMDVPTGNGVFSTAQGAGTSQVWIDPGSVRDPALLTGHAYSIDFAVVGGNTTYSVTDTTTGTVLQAGQPFVSGQQIQFDGLAVTAAGVPADGNSLQVTPSARSDLFALMDQAINGIRNASSGAQVAQSVNQSLAQLDSGLARMSASRGRAGDLLNQVDNITSRQDSRSLQLEGDRSRAEDIDMVKALSDFKNTETAYTAALGSYAQIQKLSLFNFIN